MIDPSDSFEPVLKLALAQCLGCVVYGDVEGVEEVLLTLVIGALKELFA